MAFSKLFKCKIDPKHNVTQECATFSSCIRICFKCYITSYILLILKQIKFLPIFMTLATTARFARLRGSLRPRGFHQPFKNKIHKLKLHIGKIQSYHKVLQSEQKSWNHLHYILSTGMLPTLLVRLYMQQNSNVSQCASNVVKYSIE